MNGSRPGLIWKLALLASLAANAVLAWLVYDTLAALRAAPKPPPTVTRETQPYAALGSFLAENNHIPDLQWSTAQFEAFVSGLRGTYEGRGVPLDDEAKKLRDDISARVQQMLDARRPDPMAAYFRTLREKEGVQQTKSGLHYRITEEGFGEPPPAEAVVVASYTARMPGGESLPQLSRTRAESKLSELLPGLREGIGLLRVGGKGLIYVPPALSFGDKEWPNSVPRGAPIIFFVELHDVKAADR